MYFNRKSIRLDGFDYSREGMYFVTIDTQDKEKRFGEIISKKMVLSDFGCIINNIICEIPIFYEGVCVVEYVVMPDHVHLIIQINNVGADSYIRPNLNGIANPRQGRKWDSARTINYSLSEIIQRFKILSTKKYIDGVKNSGWKRYIKRIWQRDYYERIIRNEAEFNRIRRYIRKNPINFGVEE